MSPGRERNYWPWEADPSKPRDERGFFSSIFGLPALSKEAAAAEAASRVAAARVLQDEIRGQRSRARATNAPQLREVQLGGNMLSDAGPEEKVAQVALEAKYAAELEASASKAGAEAEAEDEAEAQLEAEFAAADRAAAEKALRAAMPGWFSSADPALLGQAVAAGRQHGASAELLSRAEEALAKAEASDIYVEVPASAVRGAADHETTAAGAAVGTPMRRSGGRAASPASSMYAEQGSVYGPRPAVSTRLGGTGGSCPGGGTGGGGDFLARLEELEERRAMGLLHPQ